MQASSVTSALSQILRRPAGEFAARSDKALGRIKAAFEVLDLSKVEPEAWEVLHEARQTLHYDDLGVRGDHLTAEAFRKLASIVGIADGRLTQTLWEWMALPAQANLACSSDRPPLQRAKAFVVILAHAILRGQSDSKLALAAGVAYLTLLQSEGARLSWSTLLQPALFSSLLNMFEPFCHSSRSRHISAKDCREKEDCPPNIEQAAADYDDQLYQAEAIDRCTIEGAEELLSVLGRFLRSSSGSLDEDFLAMAIDRLTSITLHAEEESLTRHALAGLSAVISGGGCRDEVRTVAAGVLRGLLPALLMAQDIRCLSRFAPTKKLQSKRVLVLDFMADVVRSHPELVSVRVHSERQDSQVSDSWLQEHEQSPNSQAGSMGMDAPLLTLLQLACVKAPERAEWRTAAADGIVALLSRVSSLELRFDGHSLCFIEYIRRLVHCDRIGWRSVALEIIVLLIERSEDVFSGFEENERIALSKRLLEYLVMRCSDTALSLRRRALSGIASVVTCLSKYPEGVEIIRILWDSAARSTCEVRLSALFARAATDGSANVRRAALSIFDAALPSICSQAETPGDAIPVHFRLALLGCLGKDESPMVRKAAISSISLLARTWSAEVTALLWVGNVLPLSHDPESSVAEKAVSDINNMVLEPLRRPRRGCDLASLSMLTSVIERDPDSTQYFRCALRAHVKSGKGASPDSLLSAALEHAGASLNRAPSDWPLIPWILIEELSALGSARSTSSATQTVLKAWDKFDSGGVAVDINAAGSWMRSRLLGALGHLAPGLTQAWTATLKRTFLERLGSLSVDCEGVRDMMVALERFDACRGEAGAAQTLAWQSALAKALDGKLCWLVKHAQDEHDQRHQSALCRCIFTLGQLASSGAAVDAMSYRSFSEIQSIATQAMRSHDTSTIGSAAVRSHAFAALGKVCLQREELAKKNVELFVLHLDSREAFEVRNNALLVLGDLCARYTCLVERFVVSMARLLCDENSLLRKQAVLVLSSLLSEGYIHFRGMLVHRFLCVLGDPSESIRNVAEYVAVRILHPANPDAISSAFVDLVCVLTGWAGHPSHQDSPLGNKGFELLEFPERRFKIYNFILAMLPDEKKLSIFSQLITDFLGAFLDHEVYVAIPMSQEDAAGQALCDVLSLLESKQLRVDFSARKPAEEDDSPQQAGETQASSSQPMAASRNCALTTMLKRIVREHVMPVLVSLKNVMERRHSPFLGRLRTCMCALLKEFKEDLRDILASDPQLAAEIAYDLREDAIVPASPFSRPDARAPPSRESSSTPQGFLPDHSSAGGGSKAGTVSPHRPRNLMAAFDCSLADEVRPAKRALFRRTSAEEAEADASAHTSMGPPSRKRPRVSEQFPGSPQQAGPSSLGRPISTPQSSSTKSRSLVDTMEKLRARQILSDARDVIDSGSVGERRPAASVDQPDNPDEMQERRQDLEMAFAVAEHWQSKADKDPTSANKAEAGKALGRAHALMHRLGDMPGDLC